MPKKVLATNCKIIVLPQGWTAKVNDKGTALVSVPDNLSGMFGGTFIAPKISLNGFQAESFDGVNKLEMIGAPAGFDESSFHDF